DGTGDRLRGWGLRRIAQPADPELVRRRPAAAGRGATIGDGIEVGDERALVDLAFGLVGAGGVADRREEFRGECAMRLDEFEAVTAKRAGVEEPEAGGKEAHAAPSYPAFHEKRCPALKAGHPCRLR